MERVKAPLSVILITKNEEHNIIDCLQGVMWADDIVLVDAQSTDHTVELARKFTANVFIAEWKGYAAAKNLALEHTTNEWVLWLDADERVTFELAREIQDIIYSDESAHQAYAVARRAFFLGKWIKHCGWYPGYVVRLFMKSSANFTASRVHEKLNVEGTSGRLTNDLLHYTDENLYHYFSKLNRYTSLAAEDVIQAGKKPTLYDLFVRPSYIFFKMYLLRLGYLDGMHGLVLSLLSMSYVFIKYAKMWELYYHLDRAEENR